jgi:glucokinase
MKRTTVGIDMGGTIIKVGIVQDGQMIAYDALKSDSGNGLERKLPEIETCVKALLQQQQISLSSIEGVGVSFPALVDSVNGRVISTNAKYDDAPNLDLKTWSQHCFGGKFYIDNDARLAVVGEWQYGAAQGCDSLVMATLGTGIGCGVIIQGKILTGAHFQAGVLGGHLAVDYKGRRCSCGNTGCIESMSASFFLNDIVRDNQGISEDFYRRYAPFDYKILFDLYREGNPDAQKICHYCMDIWSAGIVNWIHAYDPAMIVLGGGVMKSADIIIPYIQERVNSLAWTPWGKVKIVESELKDHAGILGAAYCVFKTIELVP